MRARRRRRRGNALAGVGERVGNEGQVGANHLGMVNRWRRFVTLFARESAPLVVGVAMSDKIALSDMIRKGLGRNAKSREIRPSGRLDGS